MFSLLIVLGVIFIAGGIYLTFMFNQSTEDEINSEVDLELHDDINEDVFDSFESILESVISIEEPVEAEQYKIDTKDIVNKLESGICTLEEACGILNMPKGEVLLLKNIYKKYQQ